MGQKHWSRMPSWQGPTLPNVSQPLDSPPIAYGTGMHGIDDEAEAPRWLSTSQMVQDILSDDPKHQMEGLKHMNNLLATMEQGKGPIIPSGVILKVPEFLQGTNLNLQCEAARTVGLITVCSPGSISPDVELGVTTNLIKLLSLSAVDVVVQASRTLGMMAAERPRIRNSILEQGGLLPMLDLLTSGTRSIPIMRSASNAVGCLCMSKGLLADWELVKPTLPVMIQLVGTVADVEVLDSALRSLYALTRSVRGVESAIQQGAIPPVVGCLAHPSRRIQKQAVIVAGNLSFGDETQVMTLVSSGILPIVRTLLLSDTYTQPRALCFIVSCIINESSALLQCVIEAQLIPALINIFHNSTETLREAASWAICRAACVATNTTRPQVHYLVDQGCIQPLCEILESTNDGLFQDAVRGLYNILEAGRRESVATVNRYAACIRAGGGLWKIHTMSYHSSSQTSRRATSIARELAD